MKETTEFLSEHISPEIMKIINFITDKEYLYEQENKEKIKKDVFDKYGEAGIKIFDDLTNNNQDETDCPDCNCNEEDILQEDDFDIDEEEILDKIASHFGNILYENQEEIIEYKDVELFIKNTNPEFLKKINMEIILKLMTMILHKGLDDCWIFDRFFNFNSIPKNIVEEVKNEH